ncbi:hypothetical protein ABKN59_009096 [Abortiporus biennis]
MHSRRRSGSDARLENPEVDVDTALEVVSSPRKRRGSSAKAGSSHPHRPTTGEIARERKLREDPLCIIHNPQLVQCQRCGTKIKLSQKSGFDPEHWQRHRERCLKKPKVVVEEMKENNQASTPISPKQFKASPKSSPKVSPKRTKRTWPEEVHIRTPPTKRQRRTSVSATPPLTPDGGGDDDLSSLTSITSTTIKEESPIPDVPIPESEPQSEQDVEQGRTHDLQEDLYLKRCIHSPSVSPTYTITRNIHHYPSAPPQPHHPFRTETVEEYLLRSRNHYLPSLPRENQILWNYWSRQPAPMFREPYSDCQPTKEGDLSDDSGKNDSDDGSWSSPRHFIPTFKESCLRQTS